MRPARSLPRRVRPVSGGIRAAPPCSAPGAMLAPSVPRSSALLSASAMRGYIEEQHVRRKVPVVTGYSGTEGYGDFTGLHWAVLVRMDRSDILAPIRAVLRNLALAGALIVLPLLGFLLW